MKLLPLIDQCMQEAGCTRQQLDGVAYTAGPGLIGALLVGASIGRALALALDVPAIGILEDGSNWLLAEIDLSDRQSASDIAANVSLKCRWRHCVA